MPRAATAKRSKAATKHAYAKRTAVVGRGAYRKATATRAPARAKGMRYPGAGAAIGSTIGSAFGPAGSAIGGLLGGAAHKLAHSIFGFGDYQVKRNSLILEETNGPPMVMNGGKEFIVRHREYLTDVYSAAGTANSPSPFALQSFPINPGNFVTFPWLASIADKFEQYRIEGMVFEYKSNYSDAVVTNSGSLGTVILATEYNSGSPSFTSKQAMENYQFAQSAKPSLSILHPIECARSQNVLTELYVRPGGVPAGEDVKTYDFADFQIASQGIPLGSTGAAQNMGELWISYQLALIKPKIPTTAASYVDSGFAAFSTKTGSAPFGATAMPINNVSRLTPSNIEVYVTADNTFTLQLGSTPMKYQIDAHWKAFSDTYSALDAWKAPTLGFTNASSVNSGSSGVYINELIPLRSPGSNGTGCSTTYFLQVPAATPSAPTATLVWANFLADQVPAVRFDCYWNAVPINLVA